MKNVVFVTPDLKSGGSERAAANLTYLLKDKCKIYYVVFDSDDISYDINAELIDLNVPANPSVIRKIINTFRRAYGIRKVVKEKNIDTVVSFTSIANRAVRFANLKCRTIGACRGFEHLKLHPDEYKKMLDSGAELLFNSKEAADFFEEKFGKQDKIFVIENAIDFEKISKKSEEKIDEKFAEFFNSHRVISNVGIFSRHKGHWDLLKSFEIIKEKIPDAGLVIVGHRGLLEDDIKDMVKRNKFADDILLVGYQENPFKFVKNSEVFALSSVSEGFPNVLLEAMAVETPCVATACKTGPREIMSDKNLGEIEDDFVITENGILVPAFEEKPDFDYNNKNKKHQIFADAIIKMMSDDDLKKSCTAHAKERVKQNSFDAIGQMYFDYL
ncbi:MAG: glycosyltransferase [Clostridia bacterium]|nr:glycosyltransferase [Clostridia bacterium]